VYRQFGYELYPTAALDKETSPADPKLQLKNRRYRYEVLAGKALRVETVEKRDTVWLVGMTEESSGRRAFGLTHKSAIKGIALLDDLEEAQARWTGKTVYARNRQINTFDSASGKMGSVKVAIETPLTVTGVRWGILPLPPQPLWLMVRTPDSAQGFVPVHVSWTNVMDDVRRLDLEPWAEFVFRQNPRTQYKWDDEVWAQINAHHLTTGMTFDQAWVCWGESLSRDTVVDGGIPLTRWTYKGEHVLFRDGVVVKTVGR